MRIRKVKLMGFGTFNKGLEVEFPDSHLNVIIGRNEAGKSTLMSAMFGVLFGFKDAALQRKFEPWENYEEYAGEVELTADDGRVFRVRRNFADNTAEIGELKPDGTYDPQFLGSANPRGHTDDDIDYYRRIEELVGFQDEAVFRGTAFVGQSALHTSINDQIRKLVSGSNSTDFKGVLHDLHSRFSDLTMENPWRQRSKARPRKIEKLRKSLDTNIERLESARDNFMKTMSLEQEVKKLETKQAQAKTGLEDNRRTLAQFERFCKLVRDRDAARERFSEADRRRSTYLEIRSEVKRIDEELRTKLAHMKNVGEEFPELVARLRSEVRELEQEEALLRRDRDLLAELRPIPNNKLGALLAVLGVGLGAILFQTVSPASGGLVALVLGGGLFFLGRTMATGFKERQAELQARIDGRAQAARLRREGIDAIIQDTDGLLAKADPERLLKDFRRQRELMSERARRVSSMKVLGAREEIEATYEKTAEENLRCNGLMEIILRDAPYLREISEEPVAIARSMEELRRRIEELVEEVEVTGEVLTEAKIALARATSDVDYDLPTLEGEVREERHRLDRLEMERDALRVVIDVLEECVTEFQEGDLTRLSEEVSEIFRGITGNRYTRVTLSPNMEPMLTKYDNTHIQPSDLSQGTQDQLYFAMRVAIARHLSKNVSLPFFLDDPFVNFDEERLEVTQELLDRLDDHQIVMVTCDRTYEGWTSRALDMDTARAEASVAGGPVKVCAAPPANPENN